MFCLLDRNSVKPTKQKFDNDGSVYERLELSVEGVRIVLDCGSSEILPLLTQYLCVTNRQMDRGAIDELLYPLCMAALC